jgi:hypothetical protein
MVQQEPLKDHEGYPTDECLEFIRTYKPSEFMPLIKFVEEYLQEAWWMPERQFVLHRKYAGVRKLELHTGGWSGNEDIIRTLQENRILWVMMRYYMWKAGGHYYFRISI